MDPIGQFCEHLAASLADGTFVRVLLSSPLRKEGTAERIAGRCIELKGKPHLSLTFHHRTRDEVRNLPASESVTWMRERLGQDFSNALLCSTAADWQLSLAPGKRVRLIRHKASETVAPSREHDQLRHSILDCSASDWLNGLGVTVGNGLVHPGMADKFAQINRYLEIFSHLAKDAGWVGPRQEMGAPVPPLTIVDMGCGKGYLTFALWHLFRRRWRLPVQVVGIEARPELVASTNQLAQRLHAKDLQFVHGTIESVEIQAAQALIALHACDVATDHAIVRGVDLGASLIMVAPCCQKEIRPQLKHPSPLAPVLRHGVMEERMAEWVTDGLRALFLEWAGYRTKVFEFVSSEHTRKNLMIAGVRTKAPFTDPQARERILALKAFFGIDRHALDRLLGCSAGPR